jgi:predicted Rossmann fold nucleotide-binding protein DprA/Smf involved in DNA uptake
MNCRSRPLLLRQIHRVNLRLNDIYLRLNAQEEQTFQAEIDTIALNLLRQGLSMDSIAQATGLTIAQLQELQG